MRVHDDGDTLRHIPALDGLRGVAVAGVLLFHTGQLTGGYLGVDLFFVLSGFLITSLLLTERRRSERIRLGPFWARRARRLLPALFGMILGVALYALVLGEPSELHQIRGDALATLGYVANWRTIFTGGSYWAQFVRPSPLEHTWSLAIEEQFYVLWPPIVALLLWWRRGSPRVVLGVASVLALVSASWMAIRYTGGDPSRVYLGTDTRGASILVGAALAALLAWRGPVQGRVARRTLEGAGWVAAAGLAWAWIRVDGHTAGLYRGGLFACALAVAVIIACVSHPEPGSLASVLSLRPLCWLGLLSYGIYLWHWPVYVALDQQRVGLSHWPLSLLRIAVTIAIACASFFLLERPIRRGSLRRLPLRTWVPVGAAAAAAAIFFTTLGAAPVVAAATSNVDGIPRTPPPPGWTKAMVVGDSVAFSLGTVMRPLQRAARVQVVNRAVVACEWVPGPTPPADAEHRAVQHKPCTTTWRADARAYRPDVVLMMFSGDVTRGEDPPCSAVYDRDNAQRLQVAIRMFRAAHAKVVVLASQYPSFPGLRWTLPAEDRRRIDCVNRVEREVAAEEGVAFVDVNAYLCPHADCRSLDPNHTVRPDGLHFGSAARRSVGPWVLFWARATATSPAPAGGPPATALSS